MVVGSMPISIMRPGGRPGLSASLSDFLYSQSVCCGDETAPAMPQSELEYSDLEEDEGEREDEEATQQYLQSQTYARPMAVKKPHAAVAAAGARLFFHTIRFSFILCFPPL